MPPNMLRRPPFAGSDDRCDGALTKAEQGAVSGWRDRSLASDTVIEPFRIAPAEDRIPYSAFGDRGAELVRMLRGRVGNRHADTVRELESADQPLCDVAARRPAGEPVGVTATCLSIVVRPTE